MGNLIGFAALKSGYINNQRVLRMALTSSEVFSMRTLCLGSRNISIAVDGNYAYLGVYKDNSAIASNKTVNINGLRYGVASSGMSYSLTADFQSDTTPVNSIVIGNVSVSVNADGDLIVYDATTIVGTPDQEDVIFIGETPSRVVRKINNWYLVVSGV